jgi:hypothetical protein
VVASVEAVAITQHELVSVRILKYLCVAIMAD